MDQEQAEYAVEHEGRTYFFAARILRNENNILTVSTLVDGFCDIRDVCLSITVLVNTNGLAKTVNIDLEPRKPRSYAPRLTS